MTGMTIRAPAVIAFTKFICARERHRVARESGRVVDRPDPIISEYRFCNVRRNDDKVTKYVMNEVVDTFRDDPYLWFYLVAARLFNLPSTLRLFTLAQYRQWNPELWRKKLKAAREDGTIFNGAYIVSTAGVSMDKVDYVIDRILKPAWDMRKFMGGIISSASELENVHEALMGLNGMASFMAAQVIADLKYADPKKWKDFHTFCASGPGSRRGLNRVLGRDKDAPMSELAFRQTLGVLRQATNSRLKWPEPITAQDIQNCLCEYDKYERARTGEGKPKQRYSRPDLPWKETK